MSEVLDALDSGVPELEVEVHGGAVGLTSLDRVMWPKVAATKRDLIRYYVAIADRILPHVVDRPLTLARYPEGVEGPNWFQTMCPHPPEWVGTHPIRSRGGTRVTRNYCVVHDLAGLLWAVNLGTIELHPLLGKTRSFEQPDALVFDLDPGAPASLVDACRIALRVAEVLERRGLRACAKTSGALGLHVMVPLASGHPYAQTKTYARAVAAELAAQDPQNVIAIADRAARAGKVFVDWSQNDANRSIVAVYSMRALPWPAASAPLSWSEVEAAATTGSLERIPLHADQVLERAADGDLFEPLLGPGQVLT